MNRILKLALVTLAAGAIVGGLVWSFLAHRAELAGEQQSDQAIKNPTRVAKGSSGETVVTFDRETQQRMDIRTEALVAVTRRPEVGRRGDCARRYGGNGRRRHRDGSRRTQRTLKTLGGNSEGLRGKGQCPSTPLDCRV